MEGKVMYWSPIKKQFIEVEHLWQCYEAAAELNYVKEDYLNAKPNESY